MSDSETADEAEISFRYTGEYIRHVVENRDIGGWIDVEVVIGDTHIYGHSERSATGIAPMIAHKLLESVEASLNGERYLIEFHSGPYWLVVEPFEKDSVNIVACVTEEGAQNPDKRLDIERKRSHSVSRRAWGQEIIDTTQEFHDTIINMNPSLRDQEEMVEIQNEIHRVEEEWEASDKARH